MATFDPLEQLKKLADLKQAGILTPEEFEAKKAELLKHVGRSSSAVEPSVPEVQQESSLPAGDPPADDQSSRASSLQSESPGQTAPTDAAKVHEDVKSRAQLSSEAEARKQKLNRRAAVVQRRLRHAHFLETARRTAAHAPLERVGASVVAVVIWTVLALVVTTAITRSPLVLAAVVFVALAFGVAAVVHLLFVPDDNGLVHWIDSLLNEEASIQFSLDQAGRESNQAKSALQEALHTWGQLDNATESRKHRLLTGEWRMLRGQPFEDFMLEVFEDLRYRVERMKTAGSREIDLILAYGSAKIAVQAKGCAEAVGNSTIRKAQASMNLHKCHRCAVVTNSTFTQSAREFAERIGCNLVDGSQIPDLILGKLTV